MLRRLFSRYKRDKYGWFGDYSSWAKVSGEAGRYDENVILERTANALLNVKYGEAAYERNSVTFDKKQIPYPLMAFLMASASLKKKPLNVLDFGGSLGSTYYQIKEFLTPDNCASWNIVEQEHFVNCGRANFEDDILKFYSSVEECIASREIDFVLVSNSVQYLKEPHAFLAKLAAFDFEFILFDRTTFNSNPNDRLTLQIVPPEIYPASYPSWFFHQEFFLSHFSDKYKLVAEFPSYVEGEEVMLIDNAPKGTSKGFYLVNLSQYA